MRTIVSKAMGIRTPRRSERAWAAALALGPAFLLWTGEAAAQTQCRPFVTTGPTSFISCQEDSGSTHDIRIDVRNPAITTAADNRSGIYGDHSGTGGIDIDVQGGSIETTGTSAGGIVAWQRESGNVAIDVRTRIRVSGNGVYVRLSGTNGYNAGDIRVDVTGGTIRSDGDGVHARYVLPHNKNGAIAVTVAEGATVTGRRNGIYVGGAGVLSEGNSALRDQTVTVNGVVMGGTGAGVHMAGARMLVVGRTGRIGADSGVGILADGSGEFHVMVDGTVEGHIRRMDDDDWTVAVTGTVDGDVEGLGGGKHTVDVSVGGAVTGTVHLAAGSTATVGGTVERITLGNEGIVTVAPTGQVTGVSAGSHGVRVGRGSTVENRGTIAGTIGIQAGGTSKVINSGTVRSTDGPDGVAIAFTEAGSNTLMLQQGTMISGKIRGLGRDDTLDLSGVPADAVGLLTFADGTDLEAITIRRPGGIGRVINAGGALVGLDTTAFALTDDVLSDLTGNIHAAVIDTSLPAHAHEGNPTRRRVWATPFGGAREQNGDNWLADGTHYFGGGLLGADWGTDTRIGAFVGGSVGQLDVTGNRHTIDMQTVFGGVYARQELGDVLLDARMLIGSMDHDSARRIGSSTAEVEYTGFLLSPEVGVAMRIPVASRLHATPRLRVRYTKLATEGFRERVPDTNWDLRFAERDVQMLEARGEVGLPVELEAGGRIEPRVGIEGRWLLEGEMIEAASPGGGFRVSAGGETGVATGTVGLGLTLPVAESTYLMGNFEGAYTTERAWRATGYFGLTYSF